MHRHPNNPLSVAAQLFIVYHDEAVSEGKSNKMRRIGGTWNQRQLEMSTTSSLSVFIKYDFSRMLFFHSRILATSAGAGGLLLSFLMGLAFVEFNNMSVHEELQSSCFKLNHRFTHI